MRHLVVCCDGTWNTPDEEFEGVPTPTNVVRLHHALAPTDPAGSEQLCYYHPGVGTMGGLVDKFLGGGLGAGLSANIKSGYHWLATNYRSGDRISLFGFSRGAYTVRSLAGMIHACGLVAFPESATVAQRWAMVDAAYDSGYRPGKDRDPSWGDGLAFHDGPGGPVGVQFLGVWDTVGALGIPHTLGLLTLLEVPGRHAFHDTRLNPDVRHARHAVAMDETRGPFTPTLWTPSPGGLAPGQTLRQVWFPGNHRDVGGGHPQHGLSDGALRWMLDEAAAHAGLGFRANLLAQLRPDPCDVVHDDCTGLYRRLAPRPRAVPLLERAESSAVVHDSAFCRQDDPPITVGPYRPTRRLAPGTAEHLTVFAREPWNATGLYLEPGRYAFRADGEWLDGRLACGPDGTPDGHLDLAGLKDLIGTVAGWAERRFRAVTHNDAADFLGSRRVEEQPWMSLLGVVADGSVDPGTGAQLPYRPFLIGRGGEHEVTAPGYLYAFANDAWGCYANNRGALSLTVTRIG